FKAGLHFMQAAEDRGRGLQASAHLESRIENKHAAMALDLDDLIRWLEEVAIFPPLELPQLTQLAALAHRETEAYPMSSRDALDNAASGQRASGAPDAREEFE